MTVDGRFEVLELALERGRWRFLAGLVVIPACLFACAKMAITAGPLAGIAAAIVAMFVGPRVAGVLSRGRSAAQTQAILEDGALRLPELGLSIERGRIRQGIESPTDGQVILDLTGEETLRFRVEQGDAAECVLAALGVGAVQRTTTVPLERPFGRGAIGVITFFVSVILASFVAAAIERAFPRIPSVSSPLTLGLAFLMTALVLHYLGSPHIVIGIDGLRGRGMLRQPFIPYSHIKKARALDSYVRLDLVDGTVCALPIIAVDPTRVAGLVQRIERARNPAEGGCSALAHSLARASRPLTEWRSALEALAKRESFRQAPVDPEEVARIATDPGADAEQRVAAAFLLTRIAVTDGPDRVRIAADATADESLKAALQAAAEGELELAEVPSLSGRRRGRAAGR